MEREGSTQDRRRGGISELLETLLLSLSVTGIWYFCYYLLAPWIWSQNIAFQPEDITPWIRSCTNEHDGVEIYALYIMVFINIVSGFFISSLAGRLTGPVRRLMLALCAAGAIIYCWTIGFFPPMNTLPDTPLPVVVSQSIRIMLVTFPITALLYFLQRHFPRMALLAASLVLLPVCFLAKSNYAWRDYTYIFAPAQRLLDGAALSDIYFQYDLLPSLLAAGWMKFGLELNNFRTLGQAAYYLVIFGVFILSGKLFLKKELAVFLLTALILGRMYATPFDTTVVFQVTPLRLDLWLPLLLVVYRWGAYHWLAGLVCGLLLLLLKNFGIIYSVAYLQLLITLYAVEYFDTEKKPPLFGSLAAYGKRCAAPVTIMVVAFTTSYFLFRNAEYGNFAGYYQKIGIGFIQIAKKSIYWYVPAFFSMTVILLFRLRKRVSRSYLTTGFLLTYCAIGNSIYFFGRSHEHNILNIAIVLLFLFFFMLDLISRFLDQDVAGHFAPSLLKNHGVIGVAIGLIVVIIVSYSENITNRGTIQSINVANSKITYSPLVLPENFHGYMSRIKEVTNSSSKVFFADEADFAFYYYGGYAQVGFCNPFLTWIFNRDLTGYMQKLLDNGYYLVCSPTVTYLLADLRYDSKTLVGETVVVARKSKPATRAMKLPENSLRVSERSPV